MRSPNMIQKKEYLKKCHRTEKKNESTTGS